MSDASVTGLSVAASSETSLQRNAARWGFKLLLPLLIVVMELAVSLAEPRVLSLRNIINISLQSSYLLLFASAQMVVILTGGFDLSLGMGLGKLAGRTFRIGHLGNSNDLTLLAALAGCEMGLKLSGVPLAGSGVERAMAYFASHPPGSKLGRP